MEKYLSVVDKVLLLTASFCFSLSIYSVRELVIPTMISLALLLFGEYYNNKHIIAAMVIVSSITAVFMPQLMLYLPALCYNAVEKSKLNLSALAILLPLIWHGSIELSAFMGYFLLLSALCTVMRLKTHTLIASRSLGKKERDELAERSFLLQSRLDNTLTRREYELKNAALSERNRIAREIHDNVGHLLSSSILQLGAIITVEQNPDMKETLGCLKDTLNDGMNSIRASVHDLRDESIDLQGELNSVVNGFSFCEAHLKYSVFTAPCPAYSYAIVAIVKEGLSNVIRHSNATQLEVSLLENAGFYRLIISDNGKNAKTGFTDGMGLENIRERVETLGGYCNFTADNGFRIYTSFPKKQTEAEQK